MGDLKLKFNLDALKLMILFHSVNKWRKINAFYHYLNVIIFQIMLKKSHGNLYKAPRNINIVIVIISFRLESLISWHCIAAKKFRSAARKKERHLLAAILFTVRFSKQPEIGRAIFLFYEHFSILRMRQSTSNKISTKMVKSRASHLPFLVFNMVENQEIFAQKR